MVLKSVGILSAGKIMGVLGAIGGLIGGAMMAIFSLIGGALQHQAAGNNAAMPAAFVGVAAVIFLPIIYGIFGFIAGLLYAVVYNVAASIIGGLEIELVQHSP